MNFNKRILFQLLLLLFFVSLVGVLGFFIKKETEFRSKAAGSGTMILSGPSSVNLTATSFDVAVLVNTGGTSVKSRGFDISLTYPVANLQLLDIIPVNNTMLKTYMPVNPTTFDFDKAAVIAKANAGNGLEFSAVPVVKSSAAGYPLPTTPAGTPTPIFVLSDPTPANNFVTGSINLVTLRFKPLAVGSAPINFNFKVEPTPGWKNDTNISSFGVDANGASTDLLASVTNLTVAISTTATSTPTVPPGTCPNASLGNLNCTGTIDGTDLSLMLIKWSPNGPVPTPAPGQASADIAGGTGGAPDGKVDATDLSKLLLNFGK